MLDVDTAIDALTTLFEGAPEALCCLAGARGHCAGALDAQYLGIRELRHRAVPVDHVADSSLRQDRLNDAAILALRSRQEVRQHVQAGDLPQRGHRTADAGPRRGRVGPRSKGRASRYFVWWVRAQRV